MLTTSAVLPIVSRWAKNEKLTNIAKTPLGVSGILVELIKDHFRHNSKQFKFSDDPIESKIIIDLHQQWRPENCENYPGVYIKRQSYQHRAEGRVMGDYKNFFLEDGKAYEFWVPVSSSYSIICVGKEYGEIEILLSELSTYLTVFEEPIRLKLEFHRFEVNNVSGVSLLQEEKAYRYGQIDLMLTFDFIWQLILEQPLLKRTNVVSN